MPVDRVAPLLTGRAMTSQHWDNLTFLHWPVEPEAIAAFFPPGTQPDVFDGLSYVGLVPFQMVGAGPVRLPVPYFGRFCETNVRLYSVDDSDRHGILFLTLDASRLATVVLARIGLGLPYAWSSMHVTRTGDLLTYRSRRRWPERARAARSLVAVRIGEPVVADPVETWLTSRWGLHTRVAGRTIWVPNHHGPWPLHRADVEELDDDLVGACAVQVDRDRMLRPLWSPGVRTTFAWPNPVSS